MFVSSRMSPERADAPLTALRLSLNAPVVTLPDLPVAPARAGIAVQRAAGGAPRLTVAIRSLRTGQLALFDATRATGSDDGDDLDAALSFAEGMGFLFDEDLVAGPARVGSGPARGLWRELLGLESEDALRAGESVPARPPVLASRPVSAEVGHDRAPRVSLSKFRRAAALPDGRAAAPGLLLQLLAGL